MAEKKYLVNGKEQTREELFNAAELATIEANQKLVNDAGYGDIDITLLTLVEREVSQQKLYTVNPEDYLPIDHTNGGWNDYVAVLRSYYNVEGDISSWERGVDIGIKTVFSVIFWFDYRKIYNDASIRNKEDLKRQILDVLNGGFRLRNGSYRINKVYELAENIYRGFSLDEIDNQFLMHPFGGFRFEGELSIEETCKI